MADSEIEESSVPLAFDGARLDLVAVELFPNYSRSRLQRSIKDGYLRFEGSKKRPSDRVFSGGKITLEHTLQEEISWDAQFMALNLLAEDESILIVNKPSDMWFILQSEIMMGH